MEVFGDFHAGFKNQFISFNQGRTLYVMSLVTPANFYE